MAERGAVVAVAVLMLAACGTAPPPRAPIAMPRHRSRSRRPAYSIGAAAAAPRREGNGVGRYPHRDVLHRRQGGHRTLQEWPTSEPALLPTPSRKADSHFSFRQHKHLVAHPIRRSTSQPFERLPIGGPADGMLCRLAETVTATVLQIWAARLPNFGVFVRDESLLQCAQSAHGST